MSNKKNFFFACTCVHYYDDSQGPKQVCYNSEFTSSIACVVLGYHRRGVGSQVQSSLQIYIHLLPQKKIPSSRGFQSAGSQSAMVYFFLCPDFPGLPLGPLLRPRFVFLDMIRRFEGLLSIGLPLRWSMSLPRSAAAPYFFTAALLALLRAALRFF
jgi:hypothetical protein